MHYIYVKRLFYCLLFSAVVMPVGATQQGQILRFPQPSGSIHSLHHSVPQQYGGNQLSHNNGTRTTLKTEPAKRNLLQRAKDVFEKGVDMVNPVSMWGRRNINVAFKEQIGPDQSLGKAWQNAVKVELRRLAEAEGMKEVFIKHMCDKNFPRFCKDPKNRQPLVEMVQQCLTKPEVENDHTLGQAIRNSANEMAQKLFDKIYKPLNQSFIDDLETKVNELKTPKSEGGRYVNDDGSVSISLYDRFFGWAPKVKRVWQVKHIWKIPYLTYKYEVTEESWEELALLQDEYTNQKKTWYAKAWVGVCKFFDGVKNTVKSIWPFSKTLEDSLQKAAINSTLLESVAATLFKGAMAAAAAYGIWQLAKNGLPQIAKDLMTPAMQAVAAVSTTVLGCLAAVFGGGAAAGYAAYKLAEYMGFAPRDCLMIGIIVAIAVTIGTLLAMKYHKPQPKIYKQMMKTLKDLGIIAGVLVLFVGLPIVGYFVVTILSEELGIPYAISIPLSVLVLWGLYELRDTYVKKQLRKKKKQGRRKKHRKKTKATKKQEVENELHEEESQNKDTAATEANRATETTTTLQPINLSNRKKEGVDKKGSRAKRRKAKRVRA